MPPWASGAQSAEYRVSGRRAFLAARLPEAPQAMRPLPAFSSCDSDVVGREERWVLRVRAPDGTLGVLADDIHAKMAPSAAPRGHGRRAGSGEGVEHNGLRHGRGADQEFKHQRGLLRGMPASVALPPGAGVVKDCARVRVSFRKKNVCSRKRGAVGAGAVPLRPDGNAHGARTPPGAAPP